MPVSTVRNPLGMWALILGLTPIALVVLLTASIVNNSGPTTVLLFCAWLGGSIAAIVLGSMSIKAGSRGEATNKGMGVAGLVLGIISLCFVMLGFLIVGLAALL